MKIVYVTGTRADYSLARPVLERFRETQTVDLKLLVTGMHLRKSFGMTRDEIRRDGFEVLAEIDTLHDTDHPKDVLKGMGETLKGFAQVLSEEKPDVLLLLGDRDEQLMACLCGAHFGFGMAQLFAGDRSGGVDDPNRFAISGFSHLLFAASKRSQEHLVQIGEDPNHIIFSGNPALDVFEKEPLPSINDLNQEIGFPLEKKNYFVLLQHSETDAYEKSSVQIETSLRALKTQKKAVVALAPNSDSGHEAILAALQNESRQNPNFHFIPHIHHKWYRALLQHAQALIGNSSGGILETPFLQVPTINLGNRQIGRESGTNVIHCPFDTNRITQALTDISTAEFQKGMTETRFLYGTGNASQVIVQSVLEFDWKRFGPRLG